MNTQNSPHRALSLPHVVLFVFLLALLLLPSLGFFVVVHASVTKELTGSAGYQISSSKPGNTISVQANWNVPSIICNGAGSLQVSIEVRHISSDDSGSFLVASCSGMGAIAGYSLTYDGNSHHLNALPTGDTVSAGDKMFTQAIVDVTSGLTTITINDLTKGWSFTADGTETVNKASPAAVYWVVSSGNSGTATTPLPQFSAVKFSNAAANLNGHSGHIGNFIAGFTIYRMLFTDSANGHILAKPTLIASSSTGFTDKWVQGS